MADVVNDFETVFFSYEDVRRAHPSWDDVAIEDYMARLRDTIRVADKTTVLETEIEIINSEVITEIAGSAQLRGLLFRLAERVTELENNDRGMMLTQLVGATNKRINDMIERLIVEIQNLDNPIWRNQLLETARKTAEEVELLTFRAEEAWVTGINKNDIDRN